MRIYLALMAATALTACGGAGPETISGTAAPSGPTTTTTGGTSPGSGTGVTAGNGTGANVAPTGFLNVSAAKTFDAIGGLQSLNVSSTNGTLYQGNASTVRTPSGTINYDPRDGVFTLTLADSKASVTNNVRFQDPAHRTDFNGSSTPSSGVPDLQDFNYLDALTGTSTTTFFYQRPGVSTNYVTLAGYVRNPLSTTADPSIFERGALVFGDQTAQAQVPANGTASYTGGFLASMVNNDQAASKPSYLQWINGSTSVNVDFGKSTFDLAINATVGAAQMNGNTITTVSVPAGATFTAAGSGAIDLLHTGGFTGKFQSAAFSSGGTSTPIDFSSVSAGSSTAGASSIDGAFYGPNAANVGGSVRIVGGVPNQRVDIVGAFTGAKH